MKTENNCDLSGTGFVDENDKIFEIPYVFENKIIDYFKITDLAQKKTIEIIKNRKTPSSGLKISIRNKGCTGMAYRIEFADYNFNTFSFDEMAVFDDLRIFIDIKASIFVIGTIMDYVIEDFHEGFVFRNPNEKERCKCGESFRI